MMKNRFSWRLVGLAGVAACLSLAGCSWLGMGSKPQPQPCVPRAKKSARVVPADVQVFFIPDSTIRVEGSISGSEENGRYSPEYPDRRHPERTDHAAFNHLRLSGTERAFYYVTGPDWSTPTADDVLRDLRRQVAAELMDAPYGPQVAGLALASLADAYVDGRANSEAECADREEARIHVTVVTYDSEAQIRLPESYLEQGEKAALWTLASNLAAQERAAGSLDSTHRNFLRRYQGEWRKYFKAEVPPDTTNGDGDDDDPITPVRPAELEWGFTSGDGDWGTLFYNDPERPKSVKMKNTGEATLTGSVRIAGRDADKWAITSGGWRSGRQGQIEGFAESTFGVSLGEITVDGFPEQRVYEAELVFDVSGEVGKLPEAIPLRAAVDKRESGDSEEVIPVAPETPPEKTDWAPSKRLETLIGDGEIKWSWQRDRESVVLQFENAEDRDVVVLVRAQFFSEAGWSATGNAQSATQELKIEIPAGGTKRITVDSPVDEHPVTRIDLDEGEVR